MNTRNVENNIRQIFDCIQGNFPCYNIVADCLDENTPLPCALVQAETGQIRNWNKNFDRNQNPVRVFNIRLSIFDNIPNPGLLKIGNKKIAPSKSDKEYLMNTLREDMCDIIESVMSYLIDRGYPFKYIAAQDPFFTKLYPEDLDGREMFGIMAEFSIGTVYSKRPCCVGFNEEKMRTLTK